MKPLVIGIAAVFLFLGINSVCDAEPSAKDGTASSVEEAGNSVCPLTGKEVSEDYFVEHEGKRYKLCCAACGTEFKKDPKKYIAQMAPKDTCVNVDTGFRLE